MKIGLFFSFSFSFFRGCSCSRPFFLPPLEATVLQYDTPLQPTNVQNDDPRTLHLSRLLPDAPLEFRQRRRARIGKEKSQRGICLTCRQELRNAFGSTVVKKYINRFNRDERRRWILFLFPPTSLAPHSKIHRASTNNAIPWKTRAWRQASCTCTYQKMSSFIMC